MGLSPGPAWSQSKQRQQKVKASSYRMPAPILKRLIDRLPTPSVSASPDGRSLLIMEKPGLPGIAELARAELRLAGRRIDPATHGPSRIRPLSKLRIMALPGTAQRVVSGLPKGARIGRPEWSPDSRTIAFSVTGRRGIALFAADVATGRARRLTDYTLNATTGPACRWLPSSKALLCKTVPTDRGRPPGPPTVPTGPVTQESSGKKAPARTYQDLLKNRHDEALFGHYFTSGLVVVGLGGEMRSLGIRAIIVNAEPSPSGQYILVETVHRPYSYLVPIWRFPRRVEVIDRKGRLVRRIADLPLADDIPIGFDSVRTGYREFGWRADAPATLYFVEARDGGDMKRKATVHDRVYVHPAPFRGQPTVLVDLAMRYHEITWANDRLAMVQDWRWSDRRYRSLVIDPAAPGKAPRVLFERSWEDRYGDPGTPQREPTPQGTRVLKTADNGRTLFYTGDGASPAGDRPFVDKLDLASGKSTRLWRSRAPYYEQPLRILDRAGNRVLTVRESTDQQPQYFIRDLSSGKVQQLTRFPHPHPELRGMKKELIHYRRADGVALTATLYLPPAHNPARGPLPMVMWAYPLEFKSASAAGQVDDSPHRFARIDHRSPAIWLLRGYAVLDHPSMPVVGEQKTEPNDTYVEQLVASARAAIDEVVRRGVADRDRIAIAGHSYGAFMAANLLAHSDLFRAGIARSGAYNRTLTPFGFQAEERTLWQASPTYIRMSPFLHADKIDEPLLLIHGEADNNSGTYPMQSRRMYSAIKGLGGTVRLVMLPHESHGYRARESIMHMLWETDRWLSRHVKPRRARRSGR